MQVARKHMPMSGMVLGVDLAPIKAIRGCVTLQCDITTPQCRQQIKREAQDGLFDVVLHDGAPNVGGSWQSESYSQAWLVLESLKLATEFLAPKGWFVTKVSGSKPSPAQPSPAPDLSDRARCSQGLSFQGLHRAAVRVQAALPPRQRDQARGVPLRLG